MRLALIDHYDSFTFNVLDWLTGPVADRVDVVYVPYDAQAAVAEVEREGLQLVISPGPKRPEDAPQTLALLSRNLGRVPILGLCLGHQMLAHVAGASVVRAIRPCHGTRIKIQVIDKSILAGIPATFEVASYNSLTVDPRTLPPSWEVLAVSCEFEEVQAISWSCPGVAPAFGLQFHPESFLSEYRDVLRANWLRLAGCR